MDDCLFCKIAQGTIPSHKVYEDAHVLAFLDIHPLVKGHTLVIPKTHAVRYENLTSEAAAHIWKTIHRLLPAITRAVNAPASTLAINNGKEGGQEVPHVHVHILPRATGDGGGPIHALFSKRPSASTEDLARLSGLIRDGLPKASAG